MIPTIDLQLRYDNAVHVAGSNTLGGKVTAGDPSNSGIPLLHHRTGV